MTRHLLTEVIDFAADAVAEAKPPADHVEAHRLFDTAGGAVIALEGLQDTLRRECFGDPDRLGLCSECGKVIDRGSRNGHSPDGCLSIIAEPIVAIVRIPRRLRLRARYHLAKRGSAS